MYRGRWALLSIMGFVTLVLLYALHAHLQLNGLRGEMRVMLGYLATLQKSYFLETGNYSYFSEYYGASIHGEDFCKQPDGAAAVGFMVKWCHFESAPLVRYAYRVTPTQPLEQSGGLSFLAEAHSGSDQNHDSFVCRWSHQDDVWILTSDMKMNEQKSCQILGL